MDLNGATIQGAGTTVGVLEGDLSCVFLDRRLPPDGKPLIGPAARRRNPPAGVADLVGSGKLWVAQGYFTLAGSDVARWGRSSVMDLVVNDLAFHITVLKPQASMGSDEKTWVFYALFVPTPEQLKILPVLDHKPGVSAGSDPLVNYLTALLEMDSVVDFFPMPELTAR